MEDLLVKAATLVAVGLATLSSFPGTAQQQDSTAQQQQQQPATQQVPPVYPTATPQTPSQSNSGTASNSGTTLSPAAAQLKPVTGELVDKLDSKSAKQGDSVVVKTDENLQISQGTEIPMGSKLIGHVTNVQARGDGKENSQIAIQFDRAELKGGKTLSIETVIQSVTPAGDSSATSGVSNPQGAYGANSTSASVPTGAMGSSGSAPDSTSAGTSSATGSMNQGMATGAAGQNSGVANQNMDSNRPNFESNSTVQSGQSGQSGATGQPGMASQNGNSGQNGMSGQGGMNGASSMQGTPAPGSIVARNGNVAIRTTSVPGVLLANDIHGLPFSNASGMLLGAHRDVRLDQGTKFVLAVAMAPQGAGSGMNR
jgi:hypothetical protein